MSKEINLKNIRGLLAGNFRYYRDKFFKYPDWLQEQLQYRYSKCKSDCIPNKACTICECPPLKKHFLKESCNPDRFPDLMDELDWIDYKHKHNLRFDEEQNILD